ncbi:MAG: hypothetical protein K9N06_01130 [Candidatus Cloacimonetes bacterium]|nr:hypothetical protein [Candidatus Cloacimonadota bacterium]
MEWSFGSPIWVNNEPEVEIACNRILANILALPACQAFFEELFILAAAIPHIPVKVTYVTGNHDRAINNYASLQQRIRKQFKSIDLKICNYLHLNKYSLLCRHGHEWDDTCFGYEFARKVLDLSMKGRFDPACYKVQNIGEVITAEIMGGIIYRLNNTFQWQGRYDELINHIKDINNVRPALSAINCLFWSTSEEFNNEQKNDITEALWKSLEVFLNTSLAQMWIKLYIDLPLPGKISKSFLLLNNLLKDDNFDSLHKVLEIIKAAGKYFKTPADIYLKGAMADFARYPKVRFVIYGHTHQAKDVIIENKKEKGSYRYINTGTYLPQIEEAKVNGFGISKRMTITFIYSKKENGSSKGEIYIAGILELFER